MQEDSKVVVEERLDLGGEVGGEVVDDAVQLQADGGLVVEVAQEVDEVLGAGGVGDPSGDVALMHVEPGEEHGGAVAAVLELPAHGDARHRRPGRVDPALGLDAFSSTDHTMALSGGLR